ncbi:MAG: AbrB/MazE/SpoVT family DNA-binding domain-containing protein [Methylococcaceae bacterium]|jgi:AbrB family looped-hinge helix DNA binding protein
MTASTITSKGQITIPAAVRAALGVSTGDWVEFIQVDSGRFELVAATLPISRLKGMVKKTDQPVTIEAMNEAIAAAGTKAK